MVAVRMHWLGRWLVNVNDVTCRFARPWTYSVKIHIDDGFHDTMQFIHIIRPICVANEGGIVFHPRQ